MSTVIERPAAPDAPSIGRGVNRVDGPLKVTGAAPYAADARVEQPLHAILVQSTIARGTIRDIDEAAARAVDGVVEILTYRNAPRIAHTGFSFGIATTFTETGLMPLQTNVIAYWGQHIAVVIATSFEAARQAAGAMRFTYDEVPAKLDFHANRASAERAVMFFGSPLNIDRGDADAALAASATTIDATYTTPEETHNPLEPSATVASWSGNELTVYDATQWIVGTRNTLAHFFSIAPEAVHVHSPFIGGGFGCKGWTWAHTVIAAMAARVVKKPVKLVLDREQFFTSSGYRTATEQRLRLGATAEGKLNAVVHDVLMPTATIGDWEEPCGKLTQILYATDALRITHHSVKLDVAIPTAMRAPGEAPGSFALESAMDELAYATGVDPIELRVRNHADIDPDTKLPFSSKHLLECYREGARRFGWDRRSPAPRSMRDGNEWIGYGMATASYPAMAGETAVRLMVLDDGRVRVECATHDLGTGMYTIIAQVAADTLGLSIDRIDVHIGDSAFPAAPVAGGSQSTASVMPPLVTACEALKHKAGGPIDERAAGLEVTSGSKNETDDEHYAFHSFGAQFCEVRYDEELARVRVTRFTGVFDCGKILNPKTARSQMMGGIIMGLGMALMEETVRDNRTGRVVTNNFADYHVPVNADVPPLDIAFVEVPDYTFNALGVRGVGEIGITGVAAAVANAVYHASGKRIHDLPILPERLL